MLDPERMNKPGQYLQDLLGVPYADLRIGGYEQAIFEFTRLLEGLGSKLVNQEMRHRRCPWMPGPL